MKKTFVFISLALSFFSCKKEETYNYSGVYTSKRMEIMEIKLFSNNTEIKDIEKIKHFIKNTANQIFLRNYDSIVDVTNALEIEFLSDNNAKITDRVKSEVTNIQRDDDYLYFESSIISTIYNIESDPFSYEFLKHAPLYSQTIPLNPTTGFSSETKYKNCYYTIGKHEVIEVPFLSYLYKRKISEHNFSSKAASFTNNEFNDSFIQSLTANDTIAIQQFVVILDKL